MQINNQRQAEVAINQQYEVPTWNQIYDTLLNQAQKIAKSNYNPDMIVGISRGGLIPARILCDLLEVQELATMKLEFYVDINQTKSQPTITQDLSAPAAAKKVLLVDDVADSGKSLKLAAEHICFLDAKEVKTATIYSKPSSIIAPDYFERKTSSWVIFPWDAKENLTRIIAAQSSRRAVNQEVGRIIKAGLTKALAEKFLKIT